MKGAVLSLAFPLVCTYNKLNNIPNTYLRILSLNLLDEYEAKPDCETLSCADVMSDVKLM